MIYVEQEPAALAEELERDNSAYFRCESGGVESLRIWTPRAMAVVMGRGNRESTEVRSANCREDGIPVLRRSSGGGAVLLMPGCLCYSVVLCLERHPELVSARETNRLMLAMLVAAFAGEFDIRVATAGESDLAWEGRKVAGHAQRRGRRAVLFHGCLLLEADTALIGRYLCFPSRQPDYRLNRDHRDFVRNTYWEASRVGMALKRAFLSPRSLDFNIGNSHISRLFCE